jgi:single-strand DNA-binding protein
MNKVIIKGNICNYLELRYTQSNIAILKFNVAVSRNFTKEDGTRESDFISCVAYKTTAENIQKYFDKGSGRYIQQM